MTEERLLGCALIFHKHDGSDAALETTRDRAQYEDFGSLMVRLVNAMRVEAHEAFRGPATATGDDLHFRAVDLHTKTPGILHRAPGKRSFSCLRSSADESKASGVSDLPFADVSSSATPITEECSLSLERRGMVADLSSAGDVAAAAYPEEPRRRPTAQAMIERKERAASKMVKREKTLAARHVNAENAAKRREEEKALGKEERALLVQQRKEARLAKKREREEKKLRDETGEDEASDRGSDNKGSEEAGDEMPNNEKGSDVCKTRPAPFDPEVYAETDFSIKTPTRVSAPNVRDMTLYENPLSFDRHMTALCNARPPRHMEGALLRGEPSNAVEAFNGPPGTGKTFHLIDRVRAVPKSESVVVVHPTNVGAAQLYERLQAAGVHCALILPRTRVPLDTPTFAQRDNERLRIVVCTVSGRNSARLVRRAFDHVFIDEAAQIPEYLAWGLIDPAVKTMHMVGDVKQLPGVVSERGRRVGLDESLMSRMERAGFPVQQGVVQRRMHPEIVSFPNRVFYDGALSTAYSPRDTAQSDLPPYLVLGCRGAEEKHGTSWRNRDEVAQIARTVEEMAAHGMRDIVVITGYSAQCTLLSEALSVPVHTVDSFQGREADCCIVSIVRTNAEGFWSDPRRLNVALTRAKHVMRVVCHPHKTGVLGDLVRDAHERHLFVASRVRE